MQLRLVHLVKTMVFPVVMYGYESWTIKKAECWGIDAFKLWCWRRLSWVSLGLQGDQTSQSQRKSILNTDWKDRCWDSNTSATWSKELTHWKRPRCWERLRAGGEGGYRGWDGWMASLSPQTWVCTNSGRWWRSGKPGVLQSMGSQRVEHNLATEQPSAFSFLYCRFSSAPLPWNIYYF